MYLLICSNVHDEVKITKFADSWKTQKSKHFETETQFINLVKKIY